MCSSCEEVIYDNMSRQDPTYMVEKYLSNYIKKKINIDTFYHISNSTEIYSYHLKKTIKLSYYLRLKLRSKIVNHCGYCSDPGNDTSLWVRNYISIYISKEVYDIINNYFVDNELTDNGCEFFTFKEQCNKGSGYCGYNSNIICLNGCIKLIE
jgi:hypothetical protein